MLRHLKIKKLFASLLTISMFTGLCANANVLTYSYKQVNNAIVVSGTVDKNTKDIEIAVISDSKDFDNTLTIADMASLDQMDLDGKTDFSFSLPLSTATGSYKVRLNGQDFTAPTDFTVNYASLSDFNSTLTSLKGGSNMASESDFITFLSTGDNAMKLGCAEVPAGMTQAQVVTVMYDNLSGSINDVTSINDMIDMWNSSVIMTAINNNNLTNIVDYENYLDLTDPTIAKWYNHVKGQGGSTYLTSHLSKYSLNTVEDFEKALKKSLIVSVVRYPDGNLNIGEVLTDFTAITGITSNNETAKYTAVAGKAYASYDAFMTAYNNAGTQQNQQNGSQQGSSSSSDSSGGNLISSIYPSTGEEMQTIEMKFVDLHTVPWAYEAISSLYDKKIINGVSETRFMPDESITREQVAKILVCALYLENSPYSQNFNDVDSSAWYSKYVNIAYETGICSGMDNGKFGVGLPITRQDMAVMVYNAMKIKAFNANTTQASFNDADMISPYASEAISALVNYGAINGMDGNKFEPKGTATRAQFAKVVFGVLDILR